jgi:hypothetical protein
MIMMYVVLYVLSTCPPAATTSVYRFYGKQQFPSVSETHLKTTLSKIAKDKDLTLIFNLEEA